ncbi:hypothetical protein BDB00DRAFT_767208 [Zychaea mexicana]|uniref:uncharacterized protein n=1 Tax=Zychaea mexicana TaxID=64656 RepID=UPI0022FF298E|nr:uncharacterized protein BDB00DRAFT_767208 [Zychaea mexicana]KAI9491378.1 hypothetical protein BDB00DRAFT_767208 [Zychaea mexicana]
MTEHEPTTLSQAPTSQPVNALTPPRYTLSDGVNLTTVPPTFAADGNDDAKTTEHAVTGRASLNVNQRLVLMTGVGSFWGFSIGSFIGGRHAGLQYLAENAHRLPTTVQGWYFYHKTKNYRMALGGIKRGARYAVRTGGLCLMYGALEAGLDHMRGEPDVANSVAAGAVSGAIFSTFSKFPLLFNVRYSLMFGAAFGLVTGGLSDIHRCISGNSPAYVAWIQSRLDNKVQQR